MAREPTTASYPKSALPPEEPVPSPYPLSPLRSADRGAEEEGLGDGGEDREVIAMMVLDEAHKRQVEEVMDALSEGPEGFTSDPVSVIIRRQGPP